MKLRLIAEKRDKDFFSYDVESKDMWGEKIKEAKDEFDVDFNTENDDSMDQQRVVEVPGDVKPAKFACEMYSAGGDWEFPLRYFRCELKDGYIEGRSKYSDPHFVFVPNGEQGNGQLTKTDKGTWVCPDSDFDDEEELRDEKKCWESLKTYLKELVDKEITESVLKEFNRGDAEKMMDNLLPSIRKLAHFKSRGADRDTDYDTGLVHRFTPEDEEDLVQIGLQAAWQYLTNNDKAGFRSLLLTAKSAMNRGGTKDTRVVGNMPISGSVGAGERFGAPEMPYRDEEVDPDTIAAEKPNKDRDIMLQAIEMFNGSERIKEYLRLAAQGLGPTEIGKKFGVNKSGVAQGIKKWVPAVREIAMQLKQDQILPESTCSRAPKGTSRRSRQSVVLLGIPSHKKPLQLRHISAIGYNP